MIAFLRAVLPFIPTLTSDDCCGVASSFAPKVAGTLNLDLATQHVTLDLFALFSSLSANVFNAGQADYASANAFLDGYARYRAGLVASGERSGRTLSLNWTRWQSGGMPIADAYLHELSRLGLGELDTASGLSAFYEALESRGANLLIVAGSPETVANLLRPPAAPPRLRGCASW